MTQSEAIDREFREGIAHHQEGRYAAAEAAYRAVLRQHPEHPDALHNLGVLGLQFGHAEAALPYLRRAAELLPAQLQYRFSLAECHLLRRDFTEVERLLETLAETGGQFDRRFDLATRLAQARRAVPAVQDCNPTSAAPPPILDEVRRHRDAGLFDAAENALRGAEAELEASADYWSLRALIQLQFCRDDAADAAVRRALTLDSKHPESHRIRANLALRRQDLSGAERAAEFALLLSPESPESLTTLAAVRLARASPDQAATLLDRALAIRPLAETHACYAQLELRRNRQESAARHAEMALERKPFLRPMWHLLASLYHELGRDDDVLRVLERIVELEPDNASVLANLGECYRRAKRHDDAARVLRRAVDIDPAHAVALANLGAVLQERQDFPAAIDAYRRALALNDRLPVAHKNLGTLLKFEARHWEAIESFANALECQPSYTEANHLLGAVYLDLGRIDEAGMAHERFLAAHGAGWWRTENTAPPPPDEVDIATNLLLCYWLQARHAQGAAWATRLTPLLSTDLDIRRNTRAYIIYLARLFDLVPGSSLSPPETASALALAAPSDEAFAGPLHVVGESHSLAGANQRFVWLGGLRQAQPVFLIGLKMWHLATPGPSHRRELFLERLHALPTGAHLLFTIGEIDCRKDEGIWVAARKRGRPVLEVARATVSAYLEWLEAALRPMTPAGITLQGVPAPATDLGELEAAGQVTEFLTMIAVVNQSLGDGARSRGWGFFDVYSATRDEQGRSHCRLNIDYYHLHPKIYQEAERWLL